MTLTINKALLLRKCFPDNSVTSGQLPESSQIPGLIQVFQPRDHSTHTIQENKQIEHNVDFLSQTPVYTVRPQISG